MKLSDLSFYAPLIVFVAFIVFGFMFFMVGYQCGYKEHALHVEWAETIAKAVKGGAK